MKKGTVKKIKVTSVLVKLGEDFYSNDLVCDETIGLRRVNDEVLEKIVKENFVSTYCPRISWVGWFDIATETQRFTVEEDLFM